ncbi:MAG: hypothetical protein A3G76_04475 [Acidobacteria bacterium RIFCSPLOWO2_12_FULL_65_11]|nr:MAG: hypothetical protein A3H95_05170 [Acidobacteria bacterium RIFCSPLOWO2_02_FULL_64_15]OFW28211.1 MAG: hypothetical protein A3G76_04475 [Acidobacteria bacterium RIFCSPLOWO2_12_FULL_65_11]
MTVDGLTRRLLGAATAALVGASIIVAGHAGTMAPQGATAGPTIAYVAETAVSVRLEADPTKADPTAVSVRLKADPTKDPAQPIANGFQATSSFDGLTSQDVFTAYGTRFSPPSVTGDVGPAHYVQAVNGLVRIFDKTGTAVTAPFKMSTLFATLGGICATNNDGDPTVLYDQLADRWMLSQFAFADPSTPPYSQCIAISQSGDPIGPYNLFRFAMPGNSLNRSATFGMWPDGYYMADSQYVNGDTFAGVGVFAFDRVKMISSDAAVRANATYIYYNLGAFVAVGTAFGGMLPADLGTVRRHARGATARTTGQRVRLGPAPRRSRDDFGRRRAEPAEYDSARARTAR